MITRPFAATTTLPAQKLKRNKKNLTFVNVGKKMSEEKNKFKEEMVRIINE